MFGTIVWAVCLVATGWSYLQPSFQKDHSFYCVTATSATTSGIAASGVQVYGVNRDAQNEGCWNSLSTIGKTCTTVDIFGTHFLSPGDHGGGKHDGSSPRSSPIKQADYNDGESANYDVRDDSSTSDGNLAGITTTATSIDPAPTPTAINDTGEYNLLCRYTPLRNLFRNRRSVRAVPACTPGGGCSGGSCAIRRTG